MRCSHAVSAIGLHVLVTLASRGDLAAALELDLLLGREDGGLGAEAGVLALRFI
jgi:hypothetical protein